MRHPIHDLINNATREWDAKRARQSKTLVEAVREYKRRHKRNPPKGFDKWCVAALALRARRTCRGKLIRVTLFLLCPIPDRRFEFAQANNVVLIDEFDQTFNDILPFWALPPSVIANRSQVIQADPNAITLQIVKGKVEVAGTFANHPRALDQSGLMKRWTKYVDDVNITMSGHDGPSIMMDWGTRQKHIDAAKAGKRESRQAPFFAASPRRPSTDHLCPILLPSVLTQEEADAVDEDAA